MSNIFERDLRRDSNRTLNGHLSNGTPVYRRSHGPQDSFERSNKFRHGTKEDTYRRTVKNYVRGKDPSGQPRPLIKIDDKT